MTATWLERVRRERLVLLLDLDGTLIPFASSVEDAPLDRSTENLLSALSFVGIRVVIVSGRKLQHLDRVRSSSSVWWVAEHGAWRRSSGEWEGPQTATDLDSLRATLAAVEAVPGTLIERKSQALCVHWRCVARAGRDAVIEATERTLAEWLSSNSAYERLEGIEAVEVRHKSITKGHAVAWVREQVEDAHMIAIGDSHTDEDMFVALRPDEVAVAVGTAHASRSARASLSNPAAVREFLWWMIEARTGRSDRPPPVVDIPPRS